MVNGVAKYTILFNSGKALVLAFIFSIGLLSARAFQKKDSVIVSTTDPKGWIIKTKSSAYQLVLSADGKIKQVYYGPAVHPSFNKKNVEWAKQPDEVPVRGGFPTTTPALAVVFADHVRDVALEFVRAEVINIEGRQTLKIAQKDAYYPLEVTSYIRVLPEFDILEKWTAVRNTGTKEVIKIENLQSGSVFLPADAYVLTHMAGKWAREFQLRTTKLTAGIKTLQARDFKSFTNPNWFMVRPARSGNETAPTYDQTPTDGAAWFGTLHYSGNWRIDFDKAFAGSLQIVGGINFWDTEWNLQPGAVFKTPRFTVGYTPSGSEGAAQQLSAYIRETILPEDKRKEYRPVLYNGWYATGFNISAEQQLALAKVAKQIGVELFVIDDGWFKGRNNTRAGLGDWTVDKKKFPGGLQPLIKKINAMGMDFGLWVEPEMVNPNSDLYRAHPDWVFHFPHRTRHQYRNQLMLNLAREDVYQYLLTSLSKLLSEHNIKYIKWDFNRPLSEPGWPDAPPEERRSVRIRYIGNLYRLIDTLRERFPDVWFEDCASGGGRVDLGMLSRMDQAWASDNTDPIDRIFIQYGYVGAFPANTMVSWVTHKDRHQPEAPLPFKFDVSMSGVLGIGYNITEWTTTERKLAAEKIALYKSIRSLVQQGDLYRLVSPYRTNRCALQYVSDDRSSAVVFCYNLNGSTTEKRQTNRLKLRGLDPEGAYRISIKGPTVYQGRSLMTTGILWPLDGTLQSTVLRVDKVSE